VIEGTPVPVSEHEAVLPDVDAVLPDVERGVDGLELGSTTRGVSVISGANGFGASASDCQLGGTHGNSNPVHGRDGTRCGRRRRHCRSRQPSAGAWCATARGCRRGDYMACHHVSDFIWTGTRDEAATALCGKTPSERMPRVRFRSNGASSGVNIRPLFADSRQASKRRL
jgi:hypothetical protein